MSDTDPASMIADLDAALADAGEDVTLRRVTGTQGIPFDVKLRALVRGYAPSELTNEITQQDQLFILSPTRIDARGWPGYRTPAAGRDNDPRIPAKNDVILTSRGKLTVQAGVGFYPQGVLVRIEARARGA